MNKRYQLNYYRLDKRNYVTLKKLKLTFTHLLRTQITNTKYQTLNKNCNIN